MDYPRVIWACALSTDGKTVGGVGVAFLYGTLHIEEPKRTRELKHPTVNAITSRLSVTMRVTTAFIHHYFLTFHYCLCGNQLESVGCDCGNGVRHAIDLWKSQQRSFRCCRYASWVPFRESSVACRTQTLGPTCCMSSRLFDNSGCLFLPTKSSQQVLAVACRTCLESLGNALVLRRNSTCAYA